MSYMFEILMGVMGSRLRWRTMPWMVALFGIVVGPLGVVSIYFIIIQPIAIGTYCTICLMAALAMLIMIPFSLDEIVAMIQFMIWNTRRGRPFWRAFFRGDALPGGRTGGEMSFDARPSEIFRQSARGVTVPWTLGLDDNAAPELTVWDQSRWMIVEQAKQSVLFETPVAHFLIRAFLAKGVDEFLAHITTIEAALGLRADYQKSFRVAPDRHKGMRATNRMRGRVAGLLGDRSHADQYEQLFDIRSAFLHGRAMTDISTQEQVMARSLARQVVEALILATQSGQIPSREDFLDSLLDKGAPLI